jgi:hypothetical protein
MAIDQINGAEFLEGSVHQRFKHGVVGLVALLDPGEPLAQGQEAAIDRPPLGDHPGDGSQAARHPQRTRIGVFRQRVAEQFRVEFVRLPVDVEEGARKIGAQERRAMKGRGGKKVIDRHVLGAAQGREVKVGGGEEIAGIGPAGMGRGKNQGRGQPLRLNRLALRSGVIRLRRKCPCRTSHLFRVSRRKLLRS